MSVDLKGGVVRKSSKEEVLQVWHSGRQRTGV
jgi:hypothetical protein